MTGFTATPPLGLYIHVPWCVRKCPYCDFNSHALRDGLPERAYVDALVADLGQELSRAPGREVATVFIGGGTPSLFSAAAVDRLLTAVRARVPLAPGAEITLEANPGTADGERFAGYRAAGVTRLSLGIQSFDDDLLARIGRIHDGAQAHAAIAAARRAGFDNLNLDLMFGLPGQDVRRAAADLQAAVGHAPEHLSWYELTLEPNTPFHRDPPPRPGDAELWAMQETGSALLAGAGYARYEVSAHARPGRQCRHNRNYWRFGDYLGIGAGAHGKLTDAATGTITRRAKLRHPRRYLAHAGTEACTDSTRRLTEADIVLEFAMNALRLDAGFTAAAFRAATGLPFGRIEPTVAAAVDAGLLANRGGRVRTTRRGRRYLDELLQAFVPAPVEHARTG